MKPASPGSRAYAAATASLDSERLDWLPALAALEQLRLMADGDERELVANLRASRVTWAAIGDALGMTRQGAAKRFGGGPAGR